MDILRVISGSPSAVEPVLDAIVRHAVRLSDADNGSVLLLENGVGTLAAQFGSTDEAVASLLEFYRAHPVKPGRSSLVGRVLMERHTVLIPDLSADQEYEQVPGPDTQPLSMLGVPLLRGDGIAGVIVIRRLRPGGFSPAQAKVVEAFADQAVIAIENVRLFNETNEALGQQTAISDVLEVISRTSNDVKPVFRAVLEKAMVLCDADNASIYLREGDTYRGALDLGFTPEQEAITARFPPAHFERVMQAGDPSTLTGRVAGAMRTILIPDVAADSAWEPDVDRSLVAGSSMLGVPLMGEDQVVGVMVLRRFGKGSFAERHIQLVETFAHQASIAIENVRLFNDTKDALERQTATAEILRVIAASPSDISPVLDTIAQSAVRFCAAENVTVITKEADGLLHARAHVGPIGSTKVTPWVVDRTTVTGRSIVEARTIQVPDLQAAGDEYPLGQAQALEAGERTTMAVPMIRDGLGIGALLLHRSEPRPFSDKQVELVKVFADQAVIAIENVRLFNETKEALQHQTAAAEVLEVISRTTTDLGPVFQTVLQKAIDLTSADNAAMLLREGDVYRTVARQGSTASELERDAEWEARGHADIRPGTRGTLTGRVTAERRTVHIPDLLLDEEYERMGPQVESERTMLGVPLLREGEVVGVILARRRVVQPFAPREIRLLETFAAQAVIAIENVRLFSETTEALERQTATAEVLKTISRSAFDLEAVLNTVVENAATLCGADVTWITDAAWSTARSPTSRVTAFSSGFPVAQREAALERARQRWEIAKSPGVMLRLYAEARTIHVADIETDPELHAASTMVQEMGGRTVLAVPVLREGKPIAGIVLTRRQVRSFSDREIELAETFADQAGIAIENVRLFNETKEALERQTATGEVLKVISRSAFDLQRVLDTVIDSATKLTHASAGTIWRLEGEVYRVAASSFSFSDKAMNETLRRRAIRPQDQDTVLTRAALSGRPVQVEDVQTDPGYRSSVIRDIGLRTGLAVPLLREGVPIGVLVIGRQQVRPFTEKEIELAANFADQAVIAIENARLLNEIQEKSQQLEAASRHKSEFMANMSHELRTPLNAIIGFSDVLEQRMYGTLNDQQSDYVRDIAGSGRHLLDLVNEILDLSKVEAGRMELEPSEFALQDTIHGALAFVRERAATHGITLAAEIPSDLGTVVADERKVRQVLLNLLSNAVKFTPDGGTISARARRDDGEVEVAVQDTGIGIAPEDQAKVFDEFQQVGKASDRSREGTGLGLTLAKRFIELHGGRIWVESEIGKGTTFTFAIPLRGPAQAAP